MTIQEVMQQQLSQINGQLAAYDADITNLLTLMTNLAEQRNVIVAWLAANPV